MIILHGVDKNIWEEEATSGMYGKACIDKKGYIPCMKATDINSDNFSFPSTKEYIILCINTDKVEAEIKYENEGNPNIYGLINTDAIASTIHYTFDNNDKFSMNDEIKDINIINDALEALNIKYSSHKYFRDGTYSRIILLNNEYILKQNDAKLLESEVLFSKYNKMPKLQNVVYADKDYRYIVYNFIPGDVMHTVDDAKDVFDNIKEITQSFKEYEGEEFGYIYTPSASWTEFLKTMVHDRSLTLPDSFNFLTKVYEAIEELEKYPFQKKIIHGDFGTHNFIKVDGKFAAAIDPIPVAGDALYDMLYAVVSNVELLPHVTLEFLNELSGDPVEKVKAMLTVVLFCRFSICLKYHKEDFDSYVDFWYKIIEG